MTEPREPEQYPAPTEETSEQPTPAAEPTAARFASEEPSQELWTQLPRLAAPAEPATGPEPAADLPSWAAPPTSPAPTLPSAPAWTAPAAPPAPVLPPAPVWGAPSLDTATSGWVAPPAEEPLPEPVAEEPVHEEPAPEPEPVFPPTPEPVFGQAAPEPMFQQPAPQPMSQQPAPEPVFEQPAPEPVAAPSWSAPAAVAPQPPVEPVVPVPAPQPVHSEPEPVAQWGSAQTPTEEPAAPAPAQWVSVPSPSAEAPAAQPAPVEAPAQVAEPVEAPTQVAEPVAAPEAEDVQAPTATEQVVRSDESAGSPTPYWTPAGNSPTGPVPFSQVAPGSTPVSVATPNIGPAAPSSPSPVTAPSPVATTVAHDDIFRTEQSLAASHEPSEEELKLAAERAARREAREAALVAPTAVAAAATTKAAPVRVEKRTNDKFLGSLGIFLLRLIVAGSFAIRGLGILTDLPSATKTFAATILPQPELWAIITGASSLAIALALVLGLLTRVAGLGVTLIAGGALALVYWGSSFSPFVAGQPGFYGELELLLAGVGVLFLTIGAGGWSLDRSFRDARGHDQVDEEA